MKVGIALNMLTKEGMPDAAVLAEHLALGKTRSKLRAIAHGIGVNHISQAPRESLGLLLDKNAGAVSFPALSRHTYQKAWLDGLHYEF